MKFPLSTAAAVFLACAATFPLAGCGGKPDHFPVIPTHSTPSANAFDFFCKAANGAYTALNSAPISSGIPSDAVISTYATYTPQQKAAVLKVAAPYLTVMRPGFAYPYVNPATRDWDQPITYYARFRLLAWILKLDGDIKAAHGDWSGAADDYADAMQLGVAMPHGSTMLGLQVGLACEAIGRKDLWLTVPHLTGDKARSLQARINNIESQRASITSNFAEYKYESQATLLKFYQNPNWASAIAADEVKGRRSTQAEVDEFMLDLTLKSLGKQKLFDELTGYDDAVLKQLSAPYAGKAGTLHATVDPLTRYAYSSVNQDPNEGAPLEARYVDAQTQNAMLSTELALRQYWLSHHKYPAMLSTLVPNYSARVPADPFATSGSLLYRNAAGTFVLYSVGPDGKDNSGVPITITSGHPGPWVYSKSTGDIVAGINP